MVYVDTSALVPFFIREPKSEALIAWLESSGERLASVSEAMMEEWSRTKRAPKHADWVQKR